MVSSSRSPAALLELALFASAGCTTLGPMPALIGAAPVPPERAGVELQGGAMPGYFLSAAVKEKAEGAPIVQGSALVELGQWVGLPGLTVGGRYVGDPDQGGYPEPLLGYRRFLDESRRWGAAVLAGVSYGSGDAKGASYSATRSQLELGFDLRATDESSWIELHLLGSASALALWADGTYCLDANGRFGIDCPNPPANRTRASASGLYPAAALGIAIDSGRHLGGRFHGVRLAVHFAAGAMPRVEAGEQQSATGYAALGLSLSLGFGAGR